jgi:DNA-directed RNA polymerase subunit RPC12/RpoP
MTGDDHLDGNAVGGMLIEAFGREMTDARGCCAHCGAINQLGALIAYTRGPGDVLRCPNCGVVVLVAVRLPQGVRVGFAALRWMEPAAV